MTKRDELLCAILGCGIDDLRMIDDIEYPMCDVVKKLNDLGFEEMSMDSLLNSAIELGLDKLWAAQISRLSDLYADRELGVEQTKEELEEFEKIKPLNAYVDIRFYINFLDTSVCFIRNAEIWHRYFQPELDKFCDMTGFEILDGE